ncbi:hypothetical protein SRABI106_02660 [Rahnella aquatilis]|nr:hypothetical protein SRABI106_02660 [Rahnella aquatilis]
MRTVCLRSLGDTGCRQRNTNRPRDVTEHGKQRGSVGVHFLRDGNKCDSGQRHKQETEPYRLRAAVQHQRFKIDIRCQRCRIDKRGRQQEETEGNDVTRLYNGHQLQHQRDRQHDQHRARRHHQPRECGGVTQLLLRQLRNDHRTAIQNHRHTGHQ